MGKNDFLSPKGIANASKAKGLQKLRFYCQVCAKQCRDQNGFKCHITSEAHLRQMELFGQNQSRFIDGYSEEFLKEFLQLMSISHRNSRVAANVVYNEFIANKQHTHMNSTRWTSLTEFVKYLGREGIATVDETPKGWFLTYTPEDREEKMRQQSQKRKQRAQEDASARDARLIEEQIARAAKERADRGATADAEATALRRDDDALHPPAPLLFALGGAIDKNKQKRKRVIEPNAAFGEDDDDKAPKTRAVDVKKESAVASIARAGMAAAAKKNLAEPNAETIETVPWLLPNLVVKITSKALRDAGLYKKKARVVKLADGGFVGECALLDEDLKSTTARVDQAELQTVLPAVGGAVAVVNGPMRGKRGTLMALETESFRAVVDVDGEARKFEYDDVCKVVAADA
jgi:DNA/RNA-binding protein KIN17